MKSVIYIPSLGYDRINDTVRQYANRMMKAIDENSPDVQNRYKVENREMKYDAEGNRCNVSSLVEIGDEDEKEIYRFYEFDYSKFLTERLEARTLFLRALTILWILLTRLFSVAQSFFNTREGVRVGNKLQAVYFVAMYLLLATYLISILPGLGLSLANGIQTIVSSGTDAAALPNWLVNILDSTIATILSNITLPIFSLVVLLTAQKKSTIGELAITYLGAHQYLSVGEQRNLIMGKLTRMVECIAEHEESDTKLEIHSYSFGSVLALDVLFPVDGDANVRVAKRISQLVTIGCPFDFIEIYWKGYFSNRSYENTGLQSWHNVNAELDVLASKFGQQPFKQKRFIDNDDFWKRFADIDISYNIVNPEQISKFQALLFYGVRAHQMYWDQHDIDARSCLNKLVQHTSMASARL